MQTCTPVGAHCGILKGESHPMSAAHRSPQATRTCSAIYSATRAVGHMSWEKKNSTDAFFERTAAVHEWMEK